MEVQDDVKESNDLLLGTSSDKPLSSCSTSCSPSAYISQSGVFREFAAATMLRMLFHDQIMSVINNFLYLLSYIHIYKIGQKKLWSLV